MNAFPPQLQHDRILKIHEMADEMKAAEKTVYRRIYSGKLKAAFKEGGRWLIWRSQLMIHLKAGGRHV